MILHKAFGTDFMNDEGSEIALETLIWPCYWHHYSYKRNMFCAIIAFNKILYTSVIVYVLVVQLTRAIGIRTREISNKFVFKSKCIEAPDELQ